MLLRRLMLATVFLWGCDRSNRNAVDNCSVNLNYVSSNAGNVIYESLLGSSCSKLVHNQSGGISVTVSVTAPPSLGQLENLSFQDKHILRYDAQVSSLGNGGLTTTESFRQGNSSDSSWILPWTEDSLGFVRATFVFPENSNPESFPGTVIVILKLLE